MGVSLKVPLEEGRAGILEFPMPSLKWAVIMNFC
jgi:hypothetical protein